MEDLSYILNELGENRENYFRAVSPPIIQTSNFAFETVEDLRKSLHDEYSNWIYSRGLNPTVKILRTKLAALDEAEDCLVFNSGTAATFAAVLANVKSGDHIVSVKDPYTWTRKLFSETLTRFNITTTFIDGTNLQNFIDATRVNTTLYYLESPNSWTYELQDLRGVAKIARERNIITICDNSYCTSLHQKPLTMGIDISMQTATKYIGGHSDAVSGVLCGSAEMISRIFHNELLTVGSSIQPFNAWLLIRGLRTLPIRLEKITHTTLKVLDFLKTCDRVENLIFPFDESFPQYDLAKEQMGNACGLITFSLKTKRVETIEAFCDAIHHFLMAVSWGGHESLIFPKCAAFTRDEFDASNKEMRLIRIYMGLEDADYLIKDLAQAFAVIENME